MQGALCQVLKMMIPDIVPELYPPQTKVLLILTDWMKKTPPS